MNWIIRELSYEEAVVIKYKVDERTYEMKFHYHRRQLRVTKPAMISTDADYILYEWAEGDTFNKMTSEKISASIQRAENKNDCQHDEQIKEEIAWVAWVLNEPYPTEED